jgi:hypothetical protein
MVVEESDRGLFKARFLHLLWNIGKKLGKPDSGQPNSGVSICKQKICCDVHFIVQMSSVSTWYVPKYGENRNA